MLCVTVKELNKDRAPVGTDVLLCAIWKSNEPGAVTLHHLHLKGSEIKEEAEGWPIVWAYPPITVVCLAGQLLC